MPQKYFGTNVPVSSGFDIAVKRPLDPRTVVEHVSDLKSIPDIRLYNGLKVYVEEESIEYLYNGYEWVNVKQKYGNSIWIGDSIGQGYNNNDYSYIDIAEESNYFKNVTKYSVGGATLGPYNTAEIADGYSCYEQVMAHQDDIENADIIFIQFCANDLQSIMAAAVQVGTPDDSSSQDTICAYIKKIFDKIYELNPLAKIYYLDLCCTPRIVNLVAEAYENYFNKNNWGSFDKNAMNSAWVEWSANVISTIRSYGVPIIYILENIGMNSTTMTQLTTDDYIHPNYYGHKRIFDNILARIDSINDAGGRISNQSSSQTAIVQTVQITNVNQEMTSGTCSKSSTEMYNDYLNGIFTLAMFPITGNTILITSYTSSNVAAVFPNIDSGNRVVFQVLNIVGTQATLSTLKPADRVSSWSISKNWAGQVDGARITLANGEVINASIN